MFKNLFFAFIMLLPIVGFSQTPLEREDIEKYLVGPTYLSSSNNPSNGYWEATCKLPIFVTNSGNCTIQNIDLYGVEGSYPCIEFDLWSGANTSLHKLTLNVWSKSKNLPVKISFSNGHIIIASFHVKNCLNPDFKDKSAGYIRLTERRTSDRNFNENFWKLLLNHNITKIEIEGESFVFTNFTYSKYLFNRLMKLYASKVKCCERLLKSI